jgi:MFS family permease
MNRIKEPVSIACLSLSPIALVTFVGWVHHRVQKGRPALIPNSLWKNATFSSICGTIALSCAVITSMELFCSLVFQEVQDLPAIQASIRIIPSTMVGILVNLAMGLFVHRIPAIWIVTLTSILSAVAPVLMAVLQPSWPYWGNAFIAQLLQPICCDALFTVGLIVITDVFPEDTQALAGAVFNTASQFGSALGLAILQVISTRVTEEKHGMDETMALMEGYRASFWTMFALMMLCAAIGGWGMRKTGKIGLKTD